ncbi:hypothetical protein SCLCIDRAFT_1218969 [Scleroderma citrinum Foug A]|uniref:Uncharacterized protein n=1 Tax=Scleroderma citrinum Foug A TaxID=1036808 RepID=A0A0C3DPV8_9AGAM|nr:hypothetical protein SCLCIDRAFT_1218969 [Scleroderma citrinum Foug A]
MILIMMEICVGSVGCRTRAAAHRLGPAWGRLSTEYVLVFFAPIDDLSLVLLQSGESAATHFICTVCPSGSTLLRPYSNP